MKSISFIKGLSWLIILNLLVKPVWIFFIDRQVQNVIGNVEYGNYFSLLNLSLVLIFLADLGLSNMLNQKVAHDANINVSQLFRIKMLLLFVYISFCLFIGWLTHVRTEILFYVTIIQALTSLFIFLRSIITANQYFIIDACFSIIDKFLMIIFCGGIIYGGFYGNITLLVFLRIQLACTATAIGIAILFISYKGLLQVASKVKNRNLVRSVLPFTLIILLMSAHNRLDGFLLERIHHDGAYQAGIYASAYRLLDASNMLGYLAASFLVPYIARNQLNNSLIKDTVVKIRLGLLSFAIILVSFTFLFAPWIQKILYYSDSTYRSQVLEFCIASLPAYYLLQIYGSVLTAKAMFRPFIFILFLSVIINCILNIELIPSFGALGCCIAALISQYFCSIASFITASRSISERDKQR